MPNLMRASGRRAGLGVALCAALVTTARGQTPAGDAARGAPLLLLPVQGNVSMLVGPGGNLTVQVGRDGVLLVDTMLDGLAPAIAAQVKTLSTLPIRYIINTSADADHVGGNAGLGALGATGSRTVPGGGATVIAHENVVRRMSRPTQGAQPGLPNDEYFTPVKDLYFNGEPVFVIHAPNAHTDGDSIVLFRRSDAISAGDHLHARSVSGDRHRPRRQRAGCHRGVEPTAAARRAGTPAGWRHPHHPRPRPALERSRRRGVPRHGRDRARPHQDLVGKGRSLDQVKAARPTLDYDGQYGNPDSFVEAVYTSLRAVN